MFIWPKTGSHFKMTRHSNGLSERVRNAHAFVSEMLLEMFIICRSTLSPKQTLLKIVTTNTQTFVSLQGLFRSLSLFLCYFFSSGVLVKNSIDINSPMGFWWKREKINWFVAIWWVFIFLLLLFLNEFVDCTITVSKLC